MNKIKYLVIFVLIISTNYGFSQADYDKILFQPDSIPQDTLPAFEIAPTPKKQLEHPYLFFNKKDIYDLVIRVNHPELYTQWEQVKNDALSAESSWNYISNAIIPGCLAYQITKDTIYAIPAIQQLLRLLNCKHNWDTPEPNTKDIKYLNWDVADKALAIAYAYDMLGDVLTSEQKEACITTLENKIYPAFIAAHNYHYSDKKKFTDETGHSDWWTSCYFNWNSHINGAIGLAAIATLWESQQSPMVLQMARSSLKYTFAEFDQGEEECGGFDAGVSSLGMHLADLTRFYVALENTIDKTDDFFNLPGIEKSLEFYMDFIAPDKHYVPFGQTNHWRLTRPSDEMYYLGNIYNNKDFVRFIDQNTHHSSLAPFALLWRPILNDSIQPEAKTNIKLYKDIHWGFFNDKKMFLPFKAGDNAANGSQQDAGNMLLWYNDLYLLHSYSSHHNQKKYQNTIKVNGEDQLKGNPRDRDHGGHSKHFGIIDTCSIVSHNYYARMHLAPCYKDVPKYDRHILLSEQGFVLVIDDIRSKTPSTFSQNWNTRLNIDRENDSVLQIYDQRKGVNIQSKSNIPNKVNFIDSLEVKQLQFYNPELTKEAVVITLFAPFSIKSTWFEPEFLKNKMIITVHNKNKFKKYIFKKENDHYEFIKMCKEECD